jgi:hypothetical protein
MKLKNLITESSITAAIPFRDAGSITFLISTHDCGFTFIPKTSDDLQRIDTFKSNKNLDNSDISSLLGSYIWKRIGIRCTPDYKHKGSGYSVLIDTEYLIKKL